MTSMTTLTERRSAAVQDTRISSSHALVRIDRAASGDTTLHPVAVLIPAASAAWLVLIAWAAFAGGYTSLALAVITFFCALFFTLMLGLGSHAHQAGLPKVPRRSFSEFLNGTVDIQTGPVSGWQALIQTATVPVTLAVGGTIIVLCAVAAGL